MAGVFRAGSAPHALWTADRPGFTQKFLDNHAAGMRIVGLSTYLDGDRTDDKWGISGWIG